MFYSGSNANRSQTYHSFIHGISGFLRQNTGWQTGHHLCHTELKASMQDVVVDVHILTLKQKSYNEITNTTFV